VHVLGGDFDDDGRGDVLKLDVREDGGVSANGGVYVALAQERGGFATGGPWATWTTYANMKVVTGDFDGDGKTDLMKLDYPLDGSTELHVRDYIGPDWSAPRFVSSGGFSGFVHVGPLARKQLVILRLFH
jgi:hypothetical protein